MMPAIFFAAAAMPPRFYADADAADAGCRHADAAVAAAADAIAAAAACHAIATLMLLMLPRRLMILSPC